MKKYILIVFLVLISLASCTKKYDDSHIPTSYHDGVFSFDYNGQRYHQYNGVWDSGGRHGCSAFAMYHDYDEAMKDTLIIVGGVTYNGVDIRIAFRVPFEKVLSYGSVVELNNDDIYFWENQFIYRSAVLIFESFFNNSSEYIDGTFTVSMEDNNGHVSKYTNGLFKFLAKPHSGDFQRDGTYWGWNLPGYSHSWSESPYD